MANYNDGACEDLDTFSNIRYTPAWYYKKWPGFLNVESYRILANWDKGVRTEEEWARDQGIEEEKGESNRSCNSCWIYIQILSLTVKNKIRRRGNR